MLRKIKLYGPLAKFLGKRVLKADVSNAAEAVQFLVVNWPELERHMHDQYYRVELAGTDLHLDEIEVATPERHCLEYELITEIKLSICSFLPSKMLCPTSFNFQLIIMPIV